MALINCKYKNSWISKDLNNFGGNQVTKCIKSKHLLIKNIMKLKTIGYHGIAWILYFSTVIFGAFELNQHFWISLVSSHIPVLILFYVLYIWVYPRYLEKRKYPELMIYVVTTLVFAVLLRFLIFMVFSGGNLRDLSDARYMVRSWNEVKFYIPFIFISLAIHYLKKNNELIRQQHFLYNEMTEAKLALLKNQINPHFLYNTLSFLYTKSLPLNKELSESILILSEMMRYALEDNQFQKFVPLQKEVDHILNFIKIHQLRYQSLLAIDFTVNGDISSHHIPPLLLITFVENAFKHGIINDESRPVKMAINVLEDKIHFDVSNHKMKTMKEKSSGIGLQNTQNRLQLLFPGKHSLQIMENEDIYVVNLIMESKV